MHKNTKFTNTNTHKYPMLKLKMQAKRDIPCERETESVSNRAKGRPSNRARGRLRVRGRRRMRVRARLKGRLRACGRV